MAVNKTESTGTENGLVEISKLKASKGTPESVFRGVCAAEGWRPGKSVSEADYDDAVQKFLHRPVGKAGR